MVREVLEDVGVNVEVLSVVQRLEELVDVERAVVNDCHQVARARAAEFVGEGDAGEGV